MKNKKLDKYRKNLQCNRNVYATVKTLLDYVPRILDHCKKLKSGYKQNYEPYELELLTTTVHTKLKQAIKQSDLDYKNEKNLFKHIKLVSIDNYKIKYNESLRNIYSLEDSTKESYIKGLLGLSKEVIESKSKEFDISMYDMLSSAAKKYEEMFFHYKNQGHRQIVEYLSIYYTLSSCCFYSWHHNRIAQLTNLLDLDM